MCAFCASVLYRVCVCTYASMYHARPRVFDPCACAWACCMVHEDMRGVWCAHVYVCVCVLGVCVRTALLDLGARMSEHHSCATSICVCVCVRVRAGIVGDDALQTRVKSRGGREFLCASRPVFPLASPLPSAARQTPSPPYVTPFAPLPLRLSSPLRARLTTVAVSRVVAGG